MLVKCENNRCEYIDECGYCKKETITIKELKYGNSSISYCGCYERKRIRIKDNRRKVKLLEGNIHSFMVKLELNPCGCGSNVFHKENDAEHTYGVCNACGKDIYEYKEKEEFEEWKYKE